MSTRRRQCGPEGIQEIGAFGQPGSSQVWRGRKRRNTSIGHHPADESGWLRQAGCGVSWIRSWRRRSLEPAASQSQTQATPLSTSGRGDSEVAKRQRPLARARDTRTRAMWQPSGRLRCRTTGRAVARAFRPCGSENCVTSRKSLPSSSATTAFSAAATASGWPTRMMSHHPVDEHPELRAAITLLQHVYRRHGPKAHRTFNAAHSIWAAHQPSPGQTDFIGRRWAERTTSIGLRSGITTLAPR